LTIEAASFTFSPRLALWRRSVVY